MSTWIWISVILGGIGAVYLFEQQQGQQWPPTSATQQQLVQQVSALWAQRLGRALTSAEQAALAQALQSAPTTYASTLPAGQTPTTTGYQQWVLAKTQAAIAAGTSPVNPGAVAAPPGGGNPYLGTAGGPLGSFGGNPFPRFDEWGNAFFTDDRGQTYAAYSENYAPADYQNAVLWRDRAGVEWQG